MAYKKKHSLSWFIIAIFITFINNSDGLQGIPTWMCLGIKSPFIEFKAEIEILANNSISLNITRPDDYALMHQQGLEKLGTFIKPIDLRNATTGYVKSNLTKKLPFSSSSSSSSFGRRKTMTENPIIEEMDRKEIELLEETESSDPNMEFTHFHSTNTNTNNNNNNNNNNNFNNHNNFYQSNTQNNGNFNSFYNPHTINTNTYLNNNNNNNNNNNDDRRYIVPMALRNPANEPKKPFHNDFSTNIDDLKNHILMLQNLTKTDKNFQSKFVVFPNLQKDKNNTNLSSAQLMRLPQSTSPPPSTQIPSTRKITYSSVNMPKTLETTRQRLLVPAPVYPFNEDHEDDYQTSTREKITIIPQVLLLNDQTPPDDDNYGNPMNQNNDEIERKYNSERKEVRVAYSRRRNFRKYSTSTTTTTTTSTMPTTISSRQARRNLRRQRQKGNNGNGGGGAVINNGSENRKLNRRQQNCKNVFTPKCQKQRRKQLNSSFNINNNYSNSNYNNDDSKSIMMTTTITIQPSASSSNIITNNDTNYNNNNNNNNNSNSYVSSDDIILQKNYTNFRIEKQNDEQKLSRKIRSHYNQRNVVSGSNGKSGRRMRSSAHHDMYLPTRDFIIPVGSAINNNQTIAYKENINLNPDLCYKVDGMTYGQQKLCYLHPSIMPAISRGARSAIQECQHQFKNRRWNCSTTNDNTVFGPMTSIGSPEMAFIHALAAATVTSFVARACRDGQLPQCGCSRSSRPKQLHDDWTWGGCGDDLEFAYKISQDFIDIREKERKRGARGLVTVPQKNKFTDKLLSSESSSTLTITNKNNSDEGILSNSTLSSQTSTLESNNNKKDDIQGSIFKPEDLLELQEKITKEILNSKLQEKEMLELQEKINREILNSKVFNLEHHAMVYSNRKQQQQQQQGTLASLSSSQSSSTGRMKNGMSAKARSLMNLHNNEAGRRAVIKKSRITCKCHGVSGSCSLITCWQQLSSIREIGDYLREKYDEATEVKLNKRGRLEVKDPRYKVPTAHDLVYLDESPDWCRNSRQLQWPGTHGRVCNKTSSGLDGCAILCCGRGYNTKNIIVRERCNCKFHWCCQVKCEICVKVLEEHTCK